MKFCKCKKDKSIPITVQYYDMHTYLTLVPGKDGLEVKSMTFYTGPDDLTDIIESKEP